MRWVLVILWLGLGVREIAAGPSTLEGCAPILEAIQAEERDAVSPGDVAEYARQLRALALRQQAELRSACEPTNGRF